MNLKLVSVNIEGQKHLKEIRRFLRAEKPDVVAMMEVFEDTLSSLAEDYPYVEFAPGYLADQNGSELIAGRRKWGEVLMSRYPLEKVQKIYLGNYGVNHLPVRGEDTHAPVLIVAEIIVHQEKYRVGTVHGTWTARGSVTERQQKEMGKMIQVLRGQEIVVAGDFNVSRGNEIYRQLSTCYRDNVPTNVETTIDPKLHYANKEQAGRLRLVVDYVWSTPRYRVKNVRVVSGVSDHCALVCTISLV